MFNRIAIPAAVVSAVTLSTAAVAGGPLQITSKVLAETKVRAADGSTSLVLGPVKKVGPGDGVVFVLAYQNTGKQPIGNIVLDNPVPQGIAYRGPSANTPAPEVSVDGKTYGPLASLNVRTLDGARRAATPNDVTHVRWRLAAPLTAGAQGQLAFKAVLK